MIINSFDTENKVMIIAEIGNNHEGSFDIARKMIVEAAASGADAVKFQTFKTEHYVHNSQVERVARLKQFELSYDEFSQLAAFAKELNLCFISTPFDIESARFLGTICDAVKISSSDNTFYPLIEECVKSEKPIIASTGLATLEVLKKLLFYLKNEFALLHCISSYPVELKDVNLSFMKKLKQEFNCEIGYSDHSLGITVAPLAVAAGAQIIEKHFTLDKNFSDFRDHQLSTDPAEFKEMVKKIRETEMIIGDGRDIVESEKNNITPLRRSIVATRAMKQGETVTKSDITWVRPGEGIPPGYEGIILNKRLVKDVSKHEIFTPESVK